MKINDIVNESNRVRITESDFYDKKGYKKVIDDIVDYAGEFLYQHEEAMDGLDNGEHKDYFRRILLDISEAAMKALLQRYPADDWIWQSHEKHQKSKQQVNNK